MLQARPLIDGGKLPTDATAAIWITNVGLESKRYKVMFDELFEILCQMGQLADQVSSLGARTAKVPLAFTLLVPDPVLNS